MKETKERSSGKFMLTLTASERKKLKLIAVQRNTTMQSLIRHLIQTSKSIDDL
jgi:hypothetical protein